MCGHPRDHLIQAWAGILQQQEEQIGVLHTSSPLRLQCTAEALWKVCASATLITGRTAEMQHHIMYVHF